eukprot:3936002-Rhodomonas_salina.1
MAGGVQPCHVPSWTIGSRDPCRADTVTWNLKSGPADFETRRLRDSRSLRLRLTDSANGVHTGLFGAQLLRFQTRETARTRKYFKILCCWRTRTVSIWTMP